MRFVLGTSYLQKSLSKAKDNKVPKVRPGLKDISIRLKSENIDGPFTKFLSP